MKVSASFLGAKNIPKTLTDLNITDVDYIHVDVMDGKYVKNKTMSFKELANITYYTRKRLDVHLMVLNPLKLIDLYATLNVEYLTFHLDIKDDFAKIFARCHDYGIKIGLALNPKQDVTMLFPYLEKIDLVLLMSVEPGLPGQEFITDIISKIKVLKEEIKKRNLHTLISIDGGINFENVKELKDVDIVVSGTTITNSPNYQEAITKLRG